MLDAILAVSIVLSTATQFRIPNAPLGPGELGIAIWIALTATRIVMQGRQSYPATVVRFCTFWGIFAFALCVGACVGFMMDDNLYAPDVWHDSVAYFLMAVMTCFAVASSDPARSFRRLEWFLIAFSTLGIAVQLMIGWGIVPPLMTDPWYWDRFRGWSDNPNQLALFCALIVPLSVHVAVRSSAGPRILALLCGVAAFVAGRLTKSDTFLVAMVIAGTAMLIMRLRNWFTIKGAVVTPRYATAVLVVAAAVPIGVSLIPYAKSDSPNLEKVAFSLSKEKSGQATEKTADLRLQLWRQALTRGLQAGALGLGPGPHLDRPTERRSLPDSFEAHNTILDTFLQSGILGVFALLWIVGAAGAAAYAARMEGLVALVCAIVVFSIPHLIIRHPLVWIALAICLESKSALSAIPQSPAAL